MSEAYKKIHWLGAGLASVPGIRRLVAKDYPFHLWEQDMAKAEAATKGLTGNFTLHQADDADLAAAIAPGDIVVSMLPASMHAKIAKLCIEKAANFVSSSYISPEMAALDEEAKKKGLVFINEVGLDPGIDHLLSHLLVEDYKASPQFDVSNEHDYQSYCGGFPAIANDFTYKFSWSPLGVLKALKNPAKAIIGGEVIDIAKPWEAVKDYDVAFAERSETFQSYPNRNSIVFMPHYGIADDWNMKRFVRGTLRLAGWKEAWKDIFNTIETTDNDRVDAELGPLSDRLWADYSYEDGEFDRVVLTVELKVSRNGQTIWHKAKSMDSFGTRHASAMARLVSNTVSLATEAAFKGKLQPGVQAAPANPAIIREWLETIAELGDAVHHTDYCVQSRIIAAE
ncbi:saccharopine dehydrogenase C-terminal domain-containing protein [uncultured Cohaesibacter sp.]|uniref:saccharopine dehydrogenase C-terminal domain-containing protein n=1 Tax=uncultured Cohaesibacter sp. TaxID=1002546 RepID=UPI0029C874B7|nr:saccharopine dehydrogenase C-terminal domain-containing protein [uncultured Cohaesibacter sp.]